jgi:DNA-binding transcriptional ArsR family regulator
MAGKPKFAEHHLKIALIGKAISNPARVFILERLSQLNGCCTSGEMIGDIPIARSTLSQHLKELKIAGLIQGEIEPPMIKYCINPENWKIAKHLLMEFLENNSRQGDGKLKNQCSKNKEVHI